MSLLRRLKGETGHTDRQPIEQRGERIASLPPPSDAILTRKEVATWLKVKERQLERLGVPYLDLGRKTKRYLARDVLAWLEDRRVDGERST